MKKVLFYSLLILTIVFLCGTLSCGQAGDTVALEEYNAVKAQLTAAEARIAQLEDTPAVTVAAPGDPALKDEIASLQAEITELGSRITELEQQKESLTVEITSWEDRYAELTTQYEELQKTIVDLTTPEIITAELIENAIMNKINQERVAAGVPEFILGDNLYRESKLNSRVMASTGKMEYNYGVFYQELFWAAGYDSLNGIVTGALTNWKVNQYRYEHGALLANNKYGAVGVYKDGEVFFITFMAAGFP